MPSDSALQTADIKHIKTSLTISSSFPLPIFHYTTQACNFIQQWFLIYEKSYTEIVFFFYF